MNTLEQLKEYVKDSIKANPQHKDEILDLYQLCLDEIEDGGSVQHEISLCAEDIRQRIEETI